MESTTPTSIPSIRTPSFIFIELAKRLFERGSDPKSGTYFADEKPSSLPFAEQEQSE
jgi:hypothetical protein